MLELDVGELEAENIKEEALWVMGRKVSSVKVGRITGVPVSAIHHCGENKLRK